MCLFLIIYLYFCTHPPTQLMLSHIFVLSDAGGGGSRSSASGKENGMIQVPEDSVGISTLPTTSHDIKNKGTSVARCFTSTRFCYMFSSNCILNKTFVGTCYFFGSIYFKLYRYLTSSVFFSFPQKIFAALQLSLLMVLLV